jgi:arsenate reductase (thioredoxin)
MKNKILFVCIHNSARSQMAEAFVNELCKERFEARSAGIEPGKLNPVVVEVMRERGLDISRNATKSVFDILESGVIFAYVITVCDEASAERCPIFPGQAKRLHWGFPDPSALQGTPEVKLQRTREIRDMIEKRIADWCAQECVRA